MLLSIQFTLHTSIDSKKTMLRRGHSYKQPPNHHPPAYFWLFNFSVNSGTTVKRSATSPTSATWNIGASASVETPH